MSDKKEVSELVALDKQMIWHPYTQMQTANDPQVMVRGEGALLFDEKGDAYIDAISSWWVTIHGHAHPYMAQKIFEQLQQLEHVIFAGYTHPSAVRLAQRLLKHLPSKQARLFFSDNGSTAVEVAIKMAIQYFYNQGIKKTTIVSFDQAYHGDTFGAMSTGAASVFNAPFEDLLFNVVHIPVPVKGREAACKEALIEAIKTNQVSAFIFEPLVLGAGGMVMYEVEVLDELIRICHEAGVLCIADEVMTGFGRTGKTFACDHLQEQADIFCLSKGLTGGTLPMALTTCTETIYEAFLSEDATKTFFHGHSFTGNPIGCAAALASLDLLEAPACQEGIDRIVKSHAQFAQKIDGHEALLDVRQRGTILAMEFKTEQETGYLNTIRAFLSQFFLEKKMLLRPLGNVLYILPPYVITTEELQRVYDAVEEALLVWTKMKNQEKVS